jgi:hypothetical protein
MNSSRCLAKESPLRVRLMLISGDSKRCALLEGLAAEPATTGRPLLPWWDYRKVPLADPGGIHFYNNGVREAMSGSIRPFLRNGLNTGELSPSGA